MVPQESPDTGYIRFDVKFSRVLNTFKTHFVVLIAPLSDGTGSDRSRGRTRWSSCGARNRPCNTICEPSLEVNLIVS